VIDVHGRQVLHVLLSDRELYAVAGAGHRADRDGHLLAAPQVTLLEEQVGHVAVARVDDQTLDQAYLTVGSVDGFAAAHGHLTQGNLVQDDGPRDVRQADAHPARHADAGQAVVGPEARLLRSVFRVFPASRQELRLFGEVELAELGQGAAEPDAVRRHVDKTERNQPPEPLAVLGLNHKMSDRLGDGVNHYPDHLTAYPVTAACLSPDDERSRLCHAQQILPGDSPASPRSGATFFRAVFRPYAPVTRQGE
jgi:hypothetical protein